MHLEQTVALVDSKLALAWVNSNNRKMLSVVSSVANSDKDLENDFRVNWKSMIVQNEEELLRTLKLAINFLSDCEKIL